MDYILVYGRIIENGYYPEYFYSVFTSNLRNSRW